jgi:hypothetical protein
MLRKVHDPVQVRLRYDKLRSNLQNQEVLTQMSNLYDIQESFLSLRSHLQTHKVLMANRSPMIVQKFPSLKETFWKSIPMVLLLLETHLPSTMTLKDLLSWLQISPLFNPTLMRLLDPWYRKHLASTWNLDLALPIESRNRRFVLPSLDVNLLTNPVLRLQPTYLLVKLSREHNFGDLLHVPLLNQQ